MHILLIVVHVVVSIILILVVLMQGGKGAEIGAAFGGASQTVFGSSGPTDFLGKLTAWCAAIFMVTSLSLAYLSSGKSAASVVDQVPITSKRVLPETPGLPEGVKQNLPPLDQSTKPLKPSTAPKKNPSPSKTEAN